MQDDKLERDESRRAENYERVKTDVKNEVAQEVSAHAEYGSAKDRAEAERIAADMRTQAVDEIAMTEGEIKRGRVAARISQIVDYIFLLIYGLLTIRLLLNLFGARSGNDFVQFINSVTDPFYAPFKGIVPTLSNEGFSLSLPIIIALVVYMLLHLAINGLLRLVAHRKVEI